MLLRLGSMRGLDLNVFDFDHDLTWQTLFLSPDGRVLGRFGGRDADTPGKYHSLPGLRHAMGAALRRHREGPAAEAVQGPPRRAEDYPAARQLTAQACIHCHHVNEFRHAALREAGTWNLDVVWVYPQPENVGLTLDRDRGNRVSAVRADSAAARAGLRAGDELRSVDGRPVASVADVQYALHRAAAEGKVAVSWRRGESAGEGELALAAGWKKTDVSWRWSLKSLSPAPGVVGDDLGVEEKKVLGVAPNGLAVRQGSFLTPEARHAGLRTNDVIVGIDGRRPEMTARQFETFVRLTYRPGDEVTLQVLRGKERLELPMRLSR